MSIAFDAATAVSNSTPVTHPAAAGANLKICVIENGNNQGDTVTAVTWAGESMSKIVTQTTTGGTPYTSQIWAIISTTVGTHDFAITGGISYGGAVASYIGSNTLPSNFNSAAVNGLNTSITASITTNTANSWVIGFGTQNSNVGNTWTGMTDRSGNGARSLGDTNAIVTTGSHSYTWGGASSSNWTLLLMEIIESSPAPTASPFKSLLGVGL